LFAAFLLPVLFVFPEAFAGNLITILNPAGTTVTQKEQLVEGSIEEPFIKSVLLTVEPFLAKDGEKAPSRRIGIRDGNFSERISLFQGLNLIRISTLNGKELAVIPVVLISKDQSLLKDSENWGAQSQIFFTGPSESKINSSPADFKGMVGNPEIRSLDIVIVDTLDLMTGEQTRKSKGIQYLHVQVNKQQFSFSVTLKEGLNIVLAKPYGLPCDTGSMRMKSLIYEKASSNISVNEPEISGNKLLLAGKIAGNLNEKVVVRILALVEKKEEPGTISQETIFSKTVNTSSDGTFSFSVPWEPGKEKYTIKAFPTVYFYAGNESATKTLLNW